MTAKLTLYCDHVSMKSSIHCNKYTTVRINDKDLPVRQIIEESDWTMEGDDVFCEDHTD